MQLHSSKDGTTPIEVAAAMGHKTTVLRLHEMGCSVGAAAHYALSESQLSTMHAILEPLSKGGRIGAPGRPSLRCRTRAAPDRGRTRVAPSTHIPAHVYAFGAYMCVRA